jgi:peptide/nickel transport system substrate-binding protein
MKKTLWISSPRDRMRLWLAGITLLVACALQPAISVAQTELRIAESSFAGEIVDPINAGHGSSPYIAPAFDFLVTMGPDGKPAPGVASDWSVSNGGRDYTFNLRKGMKWHNGDDVTAEDVKFHFERMKKGTGPFIGFFANAINSIEVVNPHRVVFRLKEPWPDFLSLLGPSDTLVGAITPKNYIQKVGADEFSRTMVGSGPWKLIERKPGSYFLYEAVNHPFRPRPGFDRLRVMQVPEQSTRLAMLKRGEVHAATLQFDAIKEAERSGLQILEIPNAVHASINFVGVWEPRAKELNRPTQLSNVNVRKALAMAINRKELLQFLAHGKGKLAERFPAFPGTFGYNPEWEKQPLPYDPEGAKRLLREAGYPNGFTIQMHTLQLSGGPWMPQLGQIVADYWNRIGVKTEIVQSEWGTFGPQAYARPDHMLGQAYVWRVTRSAAPLARIQNYVSTEGKALMAFVPWDAEYKRIAAETNDAKREKMFQAMMDNLSETHVSIPIFYVNAIYGATKGVRNFVPYEGWPGLGLSTEHFRPAK